MESLVLYIYGKGGNAAESEHYRPLFPGFEVIGLDYQTFTPWETGAEILAAVTKLKEQYESITLIANSIGALAVRRGADSQRADVLEKCAACLHPLFSAFGGTPRRLKPRSATGSCVCGSCVHVKISPKEGFV